VKQRPVFAYRVQAAGGPEYYVLSLALHSVPSETLRRTEVWDIWLHEYPTGYTCRPMFVSLWRWRPPAPTWQCQPKPSEWSSTFSACQDRRRLFDTQSGLSQHERTVHSSSNYDTAGVVQRKKRHWEAITAPRMLHVDYTKEHQRWSVVTSG